MRRLAFSLAVLTASACVGPTDDASQVHDLRVLAVQFQPPELMANSCINDPQTLFAFVRPVKMRALIADPAGEGRDIAYTITACANVNDRKCEDEGDFVELESGITHQGELVSTLTPAATVLPDNTSLLTETITQDTYKGLGGVRMPILLKLVAGEEIVFAQKLMLYSCRFFADQKPNVNPAMPGMNLDGQLWDEKVTRTLSGSAPFVVEPVDFSDREEDYVVPSFGLDPIYLHEAWKVAWHADLGKFSSTETGGVDFAGEGEKHHNEWTPSQEAIDEGSERDVTFTFVVRDGRGGMSWLIRQGHWIP